MGNRAEWVPVQNAAPRCARNADDGHLIPARKDPAPIKVTGSGSQVGGTLKLRTRYWGGLRCVNPIADSPAPQVQSPGTGWKLLADSIISTFVAGVCLTTGSTKPGRHRPQRCWRPGPEPAERDRLATRGQLRPAEFCKRQAADKLRTRRVTSAGSIGGFGSLVGRHVWWFGPAPYDVQGRSCPTVNVRGMCIRQTLWHLVFVGTEAYGGRIGSP